MIDDRSKCRHLHIAGLFLLGLFIWPWLLWKWASNRG